MRPGPTPVQGGSVRIRLDGDWPVSPPSIRNDLGLFIAGATAAGLVVRDAAGEITPGIARQWRTRSVSGRSSEWWFALDAGTVGSQDVVDSLTAAVARESSAARWLLSPVLGAPDLARGEASEIRGLVAGAGELLVRLDAEMPDLAERLAHPSLRIWRTPGPGASRGGGPFEIEGKRSLIADRDSGASAYLDRIELIEPGAAAPVLLARLDEIDAAVVYGRAASAFVATDETHGARFRVQSLPAWDRHYLMWLNPNMRWTRDPSFRRWLDRTIDRTTMLATLFDGRGAYPCSLLSCDPSGSTDAGGPTWRVPRGVRPRLELAFERDDAVAADVAARIKADLESAGVDVRIEGLASADLDRATRDGSVQAALFYRRSWTSDAVLTLLSALHRAPYGFDAEIAALDRAAFEPLESYARVSEALSSQKRLLDGARLIPVARIDAFIATAPGLLMFTGPSASLDVERAGWAP